MGKPYTHQQPTGLAKGYVLFFALVLICVLVVEAATINERLV
jgi:hypothetical protein